MTIQTWDPNRIGGGTIELIQDPTTGIFTTNEVGFVKLPDLTLPAIDQAPYDAPAPDPDPDSDPCPDGYKLVDGVCQLIDTSSGGDGDGGGGYGGGSGDTGDTYYDTRTQEMLEKAGGTYPGGYHGPEGGFEYTGTPPYLDIDRDTQPTPPGSDRGPLDDPDRFGSYPLARQPSPEERFSSTFGEPVQKTEGGPVVQYSAQAMIDEYKDRENKIRRIANSRMSGVVKNKKIAELLAQRPTPPKFDPWSDQETEVKEYPVSKQPFFDPKQLGPGVYNQSIATADQPTKGTLVGDQFFPDTLTTPDLKGVKEVGKDLITTKLKTNIKELFEKGKKSLKIVPITVRLMSGALDAVFGVTDEDRRIQTENKNALTSLGYKTRGGNVDAGRVAGDPAEKVFAGMNMVSAKGDIMQGARNRVSTRNSTKTRARINKLSPERQKAFNDKTKEFERQIKEAQAKINQQAGDGNGGNGGNSGNGGNGGNSGGGAGGGWGDDYASQMI
jgi:hypothetical protein